MFYVESGVSVYATKRLEQYLGFNDLIDSMVWL